MPQRRPLHRIAFVAAGITGWASVTLVAAGSAAPEAQKPKSLDVPGAAAQTFFESRIRPILANQCFGCHSTAVAEPRGDLKLDSRDAMLKGGKTGPVLVPGNPDASLLLKAVRHSPGTAAMPPGRSLSAAELSAISRWVQMGAPWAETPVAAGKPIPWSMKPLRLPAIPAVRDRKWILNPIDAFVLSGLERRNLRPAPPADRVTLIRRLTFDLTGVPPTPEEIDAFLGDTSPHAYESLVDRLLASPRYGERWGRHWLDVARYGDSNGLDENLTFAYAWRYRDYIIDAFNRDLPYPRFIEEQLAGDLTPVPGDLPETHRRLTATGFLSLGAKMLAEDDPVKMEMDIVDEQLDTVGKAFLGMTLGCARCHDHKFDPITARDYYALAGVLKSTRTMENFRVVAVWHENTLGSPEERARRSRAEAGVKRLRDEATAFARAESARELAESRSRVADYLFAATARLKSDERRGGSRAANPPAGSVALEAESFARGNVLKDRTQYGAGIGVLVNAGALPNFVEYDLSAASGSYQLEFRYAAAESRPVRVLLNGELIEAGAASDVTGGWMPENQAWRVAGVLALGGGPNVLRVERTDGPFPHIDRLLLARVASASENGTVATAPPSRSPLNPYFLDRWKSALQEARTKPASPLADWVRKAGLIPGSESSDTLQSLGELATRYQMAAARATTGGEGELAELARGARGPLAPPSSPEAALRGDAATRVADLKKQADEEEKKLPDLPRAMGVSEGTATDLKIHLRGSHLNLGEPVRRGFPVRMGEPAHQEIGGSSSGRLELARWLGSPDHPLVARTLVNRVWQGHFGEGICRSPDNLGNLGEKPDHPELLDWLAVKFNATSGDHALSGSIKALHRMIVTSQTYRTSARFDAKSAQADPENRLLWRHSRRRLEAESVRDAIVALGPGLDLTMGGTLLPLKNREYVTSTANRDSTDYSSRRRAVYLPVVRSSLYDVFTAFDFGDPSVVNGRRDVTTVAPQALFMLNGSLVARSARVWAERLLALGGSDEGRLNRAYREAFGRMPVAAESARALGFLARTREQGREAAQGWESLCRVLLSSNELIFVD